MISYLRLDRGGILSENKNIECADSGVDEKRCPVNSPVGDRRAVSIVYKLFVS